MTPDIYNVRKLGPPSITALLAMLAALLLIPIGVFAFLVLSRAGDQTTAVQDIATLSDDVHDDLEVLDAVRNEVLASTWVTLGRQFPEVLGEAEGRLSVAEMDAQLAEAQREVDALLESRPDDGLRDLLLENRSSAESTRDAFGMGPSYGQTLGAIQQDLSEATSLLVRAGHRTGDDELARYAEVLEASTKFQVASSDQFYAWADLRAELLFGQPEPGNIENFTSIIGRSESDRDRLSQLTTSDPSFGDLWRNIDDSALRSAYMTTLEEAFRPNQVDAASELVDVEQVLFNLQGENEQFQSQVDELIDLALEKVDVEAARIVADTNQARRGTILLMAAAAILMALAVAGQATLVARPLRRAAQVTEKIGAGDLTVRVPESGSREVRLGARALNEAISSMQLAESQAVALAEERFDDPALETVAPGTLGQSLQVAVQKLTDSLAERDEFEERLSHEATHDGLTKIPNRTVTLRHLEAALARSRRVQTTVALLFIDIDRFKTINDVHGHQVGDKVLIEIARRLSGALRAGDVVGRIGGDEFVVVAEPVDDVMDAARLASRLLEVISEPMDLDGKTFYPSASIGVGIDNGVLTTDELLRDADLAVYRAKEEGKNQIAVCDEGLRAQWEKQERLETAIKLALERNEFELVYQPAFSPVTNRPVAFEALIRWQHPTEGLRSPDEFIPTAERTDLIAEIDRWVLDAAAAQVGAWQGVPHFDSVPIAINISARHLGSGSLVEDVSAAVKRHEILPNSLILELTETAAMEDLVTAARELAQLRKIGVRIALDDFGTGYMSLAHLRSLPIDQLKIDRSFVADLESRAEESLVHLIVDTARLLKLTVTAEGVETVEQLSALRELGVDSVQGYFFTPPRPAPHLPTQIAEVLNGVR